jgi:hypothetical protein
MYRLPILDDGVFNSDEFQKMYNLDLTGGNFIPVTNLSRPVIKNNVSTYFIDGNENQSLILENNYNPFEEITKTTEQTRQAIMDENVLRNSTSQTDREINMYLSHNQLDPRLRAQMMIDSLRDGTNLFSSQSEDFVKEVRDSYGNFLQEEFLYRPDKITRLTQVDSNKGTIDIMTPTDNKQQEISQIIIDKVLEKAKQEQQAKEQMMNQTRIRRQRFFPESFNKQKTQEERFYDKFNVTSSN